MGGSASMMADSLLSLAVTPFAEKTCPQNSSDGTPKTHLSLLIVRLCALSLAKTAFRVSMWSSSLAHIMMSSDMFLAPGMFWITSAIFFLVFFFFFLGGGYFSSTIDSKPQAFITIQALVCSESCDGSRVRVQFQLMVLILSWHK